MLTFVTGNPGNGKSLHLVTTIEEMRVKQGREVYQDGIDDLVYPWKPLPMLWRTERRKGADVKVGEPKWVEVPEGSIIVIDEAWRIFPIRGQGSAVPEYVQWLATHRHGGYDIYLATQSVKTQVDTFVRGLAGKHVHLDRKFGMEYAMRYEWERVADPTSKADQAIAQTSRWMFPEKSYGTYKSAVIHTHKRTLPWKKILTLVGLLVAAVCLFGFAFHSLGNKNKVLPVDSSGRPAGAPQVAQGLIQRDFWVKDRIPRVAGVPASAPVYDGLQKVASQPRPEGCMQLAIGASLRCECTGPNHSVLQISSQQCADLVKKGWFDETQKYPDVKSENIAQLQSARSNGEGKTIQTP